MAEENCSKFLRRDLATPTFDVEKRSVLLFAGKKGGGVRSVAHEREVRNFTWSHSDFRASGGGGRRTGEGGAAFRCRDQEDRRGNFIFRRVLHTTRIIAGGKKRGRGGVSRVPGGVRPPD